MNCVHATYAKLTEMEFDIFSALSYHRHDWL